MQRWIVMGLIAMMLLLGGAAYAYRSYQQNTPHPVWVPMPINPQLPVERRSEIAKELKAKLADPEILRQVAKDVGLAAKWKLASDAEAAAALSKVLFVKVDEMDSPTGKVPSINIGVRGKSKDSKISGEVAMRLMQDVWKILGIKPPPPKDTF